MNTHRFPVYILAIGARMATATDAAVPGSAEVLAKAQAALEARLDGQSFQVTTYWHRESADTIVEAATWTFSGGRERLVSNRLPDGGSTQTFAFNGTLAKLLRGRRDAFEGTVDSTRRDYGLASGSLLVASRLEEGKERTQGISIFQHILDPTGRESLAAAGHNATEGREYIKIMGVTGIGTYELWVDPQRGYSLVRLVAEIHDSDMPLVAWVRYEVEFLNFVRRADEWFPHQAEVVRVYEINAPGSDSSGVYVDRLEMYVDAVTSLAAPVDPAMFELNWPEGTRVIDRVAGYQYTQLGPGRVINPLDRMVHDVVVDDASQQGKATDPRFTLEAMGVPYASAGARVTLPPAVCAIGCAYAILKLEGQAALTTRIVMEELRPETSGRVAPVLLEDLFRRYGFAVRAVRNLSAASLRRADGREGLYVVLVTGRAADPMQRLNHALLYRRTTSGGDCVVVDPPLVKEYSDAQLEKRWAGGYALIVARTPGILESFLRDTKAGTLSRSAPFTLIGLGLAATGLWLARRFRGFKARLVRSVPT